MSLSEHELYSDEIHPIDIVESIAEHYDWEFDRVGDDQIAMAVAVQWWTSSITLAWSGYDEPLRLVCPFAMEPPDRKLPALYEMLNEVNDECWAGAFSYWKEPKLMVYRYGLVMPGTQGVSPEQIDTLINAAVLSAERFYPAFQLCVWGDRDPTDAMQVAICEAYGRA